MFIHTRTADINSMYRSAYGKDDSNPYKYLVYSSLLIALPLLLQIAESRITAFDVRNHPGWYFFRLLIVFFYHPGWFPGGRVVPTNSNVPPVNNGHELLEFCFFYHRGVSSRGV